MMLGLRLLQEGIAFDRFARLHGVALHDCFAAELAELQHHDLVTVDDARVRLTETRLNGR